MKRTDQGVHGIKGTCALLELESFDVIKACDPGKNGFQNQRYVRSMMKGSSFCKLSLFFFFYARLYALDVPWMYKNVCVTMDFQGKQR